MNKPQIRKSLAVALCLVAFFRPVIAGAENVTIKVATAYSADNFQTQNLQHFADDVKNMTHGNVDLKIYPSGTLIKPAEIFEGVRSGKAEAGEVIMSSLTKENPMFGIDSLPFIVSGYSDAQHMWDVSRPAVEKLMAARGLKLLYAVPWPTQNLYANREIKTLKDFHGLTMRSYNSATIRIAELIGAKPVSIQVMDLTNAISDEKLDLMITSSWTGVDTKAWSKMRYYYKVSAWIPKNMVFINMKLFEKLDAETQKKIIVAAGVAEKRGWKLSQESDQSYENQLIANKVKVSTIEYTIRNHLDILGEKLAREWLKSAGPEELQVLLKYIIDRQAAPVISKN
ncbi:MAG: TRAP transporter substrate-binding protein [Burkholderiaceae bacterium]